MTLFLNYIQNIKTKWISTILRLFCLLHDMFCLLGFFVFPIFKYSSSLRIPFLIVWFYMTIVFFALMVVATKQQVREDKKEIVEYNKNKFVYWLGRFGVLLCFAITFFMLFWLNNFTSNLSLIKIFCISAFLLLLLGVVIGLLTQYKGNYKQMFKDIFTAIGILFGLFIIIVGVLSYEAYPEISPFLTLCGGIPLLIWCINTFFKTVISPKFITGKDDIFTAAMWLFFFIGIIISFILRYAINDCALRTTLTTVMSGVLGGAITLAGVAWTIKDSNAKRQEDLERIEKERKEDERKKYIPFVNLYTNKPIKIDHNITIKATNFSKSIRNCYIFRSCFIKNTDFSAFCIAGIYFNDKVATISPNSYIDKNWFVKLIFRQVVILPEELKTCGLWARDLLGNDYIIPLDFVCQKHRNGFISVICKGCFSAQLMSKEISQEGENE